MNFYSQYSAEEQYYLVEFGLRIIFSSTLSDSTDADVHAVHHAVTVMVNAANIAIESSVRYEIFSSFYPAAHFLVRRLAGLI